MATTHALNTDPLRNFRFIVNIHHTDQAFQGLARLGFMSVTGLAAQTEVIPYREGGNNTTTRKMPGQSDYGPISLSRGALAAAVGTGATSPSTDVKVAFAWFKQIFSFIQGQGSLTSTGDFRCTMSIDVLQHPVTTGPGSPGAANPGVRQRFMVYNAWPMAIAYSDLDAGGNAVLIESLTLAHEGFDVIQSSSTAGDFLGASAVFS